MKNNIDILEVYNMKFGENILAKKYREKYNALSEEKKKEWDAVADMHYKELLPRVIKRKRKYPEKGDVFVVSPFDGVYFFGIVVNTNIRYSDCNDGLVVMIFKDYTNDISNIEFTPNFNNLFMEPSIVTQGYWTRGYFYTVDKAEIPSDLDYGFLERHPIIRDDKIVHEYKFVNEHGRPIDHEPYYLGCYGLTTDLGITMYIRKELIFDESILEK